jgi:hypothetical protein
VWRKLHTFEEKEVDEVVGQLIGEVYDGYNRHHDQEDGEHEYEEEDGMVVIEVHRDDSERRCAKRLSGVV